MNRTFKLLALAASTLAASTFASAANYTLCSSNGCTNGGSATVTSSFAQTKYPIVLAHGMGGFSQVGPLGYFYGMPADLTSNGATVFVTQVVSFGSSITRGEMLLAQVKQIEAITGARKVNIMGHSQGVLDARYVAAVAPTLVASVSGVGGPNTGSPVADVIEGASSVVGAFPSAVVADIVNAFFNLIDATSGDAYQNDALAGLSFLTSAAAASYNASFPQALPSSSNPCGQGAATVNGINYYSWGGTGHLTNPLDISDPILGLTGLAFGSTANDGLVGQCSSHLGVVLRDNYNMNHLDEINQLLGLVSIFETSPVTLFRNQANRLKVAGL